MANAKQSRSGKRAPGWLTAPLCVANIAELRTAIDRCRPWHVANFRVRLRGGREMDYGKAVAAAVKARGGKRWWTQTNGKAAA